MGKGIKYRVAEHGAVSDNHVSYYHLNPREGLFVREIVKCADEVGKVKVRGCCCLFEIQE